MTFILMGGMDLAGKSGKWPPNSLKYYRKLKGLTQESLGRRIRGTHQLIEKLENRKNELTQTYAEQIGNVLGVPAAYLGYPGYGWLKLVRVVAELDDGRQVRFYPRHHGRVGVIGVPSETVVAIKVLPGALPGFEDWVIPYDPAAKEPMSQQILQRQEAGARFVISLANGSAWCMRTIVPGSRRGTYHLSLIGAGYLPDVEIAWVSEVFHMQPPRQLPPPYQDGSDDTNDNPTGAPNNGDGSGTLLAPDIN